MLTTMNPRFLHHLLTGLATAINEQRFKPTSQQAVINYQEAQVVNQGANDELIATDPIDHREVRVLTPWQLRQLTPLETLGHLTHQEFRQLAKAIQINQPDQLTLTVDQIIGSSIVPD